MVFKILQKSKNFGDTFLINISWDHVRSDKKFGPTRFRRIDKQTNKQTKQSIFIEDALLFVAGHSLQLKMNLPITLLRSSGRAARSATLAATLHLCF